MSAPISPSFSVDRVGWNCVYERELNKIYDVGEKPNYKGPSLVDGLGKDVYQLVASSDPTMQTLSAMRKELTTLQRDLSRKSALVFAENDFQSQWQEKCTPKMREKWILEGLVRTCEASPEFEERRRLCPETTLARLNRGNGQGFLDLLQSLLLQDIDTIPSDIKTVPSESFDRMNGVDKPGPDDHGIKAFQRMNTLCRTYFLTMFVWNTILAFHGESETFGLSKGKEDVKKSTAQVAKGVGLDYRQLRNEISTNRQTAERHCTTCNLPARLAGVKTLVACAKCKNMGRYVYYCGKECQVKDWKHGNPPHKEICGDKAALRDAALSSPSSKSADDDDSGKSWPDPEPGYTRSPALQHQLKLLSENPQFDYVFVRPYPQEDHGLILQDFMGKMLFLISMKRAVAKYAPREVHIMYQCLEPSAACLPNFGKAKLKAQLKKEYGVDIDEVKEILDRQREQAGPQ